MTFTKCRRLCHRVLRNQPLGTVGTPDPDAITALDAERHESARDALDLALQLGIRVSDVLMARDKGFVAAECGRDPVEALADRLAEQRHIRPPAHVGGTHRGGL